MALLIVGHLALARFLYVPAPGGIGWAAARVGCQSRGGDLASIHSAAEQAQLVALAPRLGASHDYWIGLNDIAREGTWVWSDGTPVDYSAWSTITTPFSRNGEPNGDGDCAQLWQPKHKNRFITLHF